MKREELFFLSLLRDALCEEKKTVVPADLDWDALYALADAQSLLGLCYSQLKTLAGSGAAIPEDALQRFHEGLFGDVYLAVNQGRAMDRVFDAFSREGIPLLPFKGWRVREAWPEACLRTMGDVDLLIHPEDRERADALMLSLGYEKYVDNHAVWTYFARDILIEIHDHMFYEHLVSDVDYQAYFDAAWSHVGREDEESFHLLYLFAHTAKHVINKGMGVRAFLDLCVMCRSARLQGDLLERELKRLKLFGFAGVCLAICKRWFALEPPFPIPELPEERLEALTEKIFRDGTFGLDNEENDQAKAAKEIQRSGLPYWLAAGKLLRERLFPTYSDMILSSQYAFLKGRPWLLPVAWVYRWGFALVHKRELGTSKMTEPLVNRKEIRERQELLRSWNLIE